MGSREFPYQENLVCEDCGKQGAFDIYGTFLCGECLEGPKKEEEGGLDDALE